MQATINHPIQSLNNIAPPTKTGADCIGVHHSHDVFKGSDMRSLVHAMKRRIIALFVSTMVLGCATPAGVKPGQSEAQVIATLGNPVARHRLADGSTNFEYSTAPFGQEAWMVNIFDGQVRSAKQVLTMEEFATLRIGKDRFEDVRARFGRTVDEIRLPLADRTVWSYRMKQDGIWPIWMNVQFDRDGVVREFFPTPDPATIRDRDN